MWACCGESAVANFIHYNYIFTLKSDSKTEILHKAVWPKLLNWIENVLLVYISLRLSSHYVKYNSTKTHISLFVAEPFFPAVFGLCDLALLTQGCTHVCCPSLGVCPQRSNRKLARLWSVWASTETFRLGVRKTWWHHCYRIAFWQRWGGGDLLWIYLCSVYIHTILNMSHHSPQNILKTHWKDNKICKMYRDLPY